MSKARGTLLKEKQFLDELAAFAEEQRRLVEAECEGFATDAAARDVRRTRAQGDFEFFCRSYFPHYVTSEPSLFHRWFYDNVPMRIDMPTGQLLDISAPRGEAKSTLGTQLLTLWVVVTARQHFVPIVMDAVGQAATMLEAVKVELESNPRLSMDFPASTGAGRVWNAGVIVTRNNIKVQAFGTGKRMRGLRHGPHRPGLVLLDDIENDENVRSKEQRDKDENWVKKVVLPLGPPKGTMHVVYLNTILHYDSVANRFHRNPRWVRVKFKAIVRWPDSMDLWQAWEELFINEGEDVADAFYAQRRAEMDAGAVVSWPSTRPLLMLMKIRAGDHHAFDCEYQNDPTNDENAWFTNMQFWVHPNRDWVFYGVLDPSLGKKKRKGDPSACLVGGWDRNHGKLSIVEAVVARMVPDRQMTKLIEFQREYMCIAWGIEATAFQEYFRQQIVAQSAALGVPIPAIPLLPTTDKDLMIQAVSPHVNNGLILFHQSHTVLNTQVRHWPEADHDDGPDAVQMLWNMCLKRSGGIPRITIGKRST